MTERNHIEIDYCPSCRGVWLDKGELDEMLEYAAQRLPFENQVRPGYGAQGGYNPHGKQQYGYNRPHKKKSFLGDLFDFD